MGRRATPKRGQAKAKRASAHTPPKSDGAKVRDLEKRLAEALEREAAALSREAVAHEKQAATADILRVISSSPTDVQPVFDAIVRAAVQLCHAVQSNVQLFDGQLMHFGAQHNLAPASMEMIQRLYPMAPNRNQTASRAVLDSAIVHVPDVLADPEYLREMAVTGGFRSVLSVPMIGKGRPIGAITVGRMEAGLFSETEITLLQTFADQAVIAIENVRLFTELQYKNEALTQAHAQVTESLEQQTATAEILRVISSSPTDVTPVLDRMAESATRFCLASDATIWRLEGDRLVVVAHHGPLTTPVGHVVPNVKGTVVGRSVLERQPVHVVDLQAESEAFPEGSANARRFGHRTILSVPLLREGGPLGAITLRRAEVVPFTAKQTTLLLTFADQAVIAIENVRLFTELQTSNRELTTALDTQTATSDILRVISRSQTDVQPVFDAILDSAVRLLGAYSGALTRVAGDQIELAALKGGTDAGAAAASVTFPQALQSERPMAQTIRDRAPVNITDAQTDPRVPEVGRANARARGFRSWAAVPLLHHDEAVGAIAVNRREPGGFRDDEIALLQTFADQAVIAIENVRLFTELQTRNSELTESLDQQTATSEILRVISRSQTDVQPVFDTIVQSAVRLCTGLFGAVFRFDGELLHMVAHHNYTPEALEAAHRVYPARPSRDHGSVRAIVERAVVHIPDVELDPEHQHPGLRRAIGQRSGLFVPMLREGDPIGVIMVARPEPRPFSNSEIELLKTFADQAVIAIENVRLFNETKEALEQQTATGEILRVIASSPTDVRPVFEAILTRAATLCEAQLGHLWLYEGGEQFRLGASYGSRPDHLQWLQQGLHRFGRPFFRESGPWRVSQVPDVRDTEPYRRGEPVWIRTADHEGMRTLLGVPLVKEGRLVGSIAVYRREIQPFTDQQTALVQTFADQAVIAIENVRLFTELQERNQALTTAHAQVTVALEQQTATAEILGAISHAQNSAEPVFDSIARSAAQLCSASIASVHLLEGDIVTLRAVTIATDEWAPFMHMFPRPLARAGVQELVVRERDVINIADLETDPRVGDYSRPFYRRFRFRSGLWVPMLRDSEVLGIIVVFHTERAAFAERHIQLLKTFADQAVIAIENVRLFTELQTSNRDLTTALDTQTATADILRIISGSRADVQPVFDAIVASAVRLLHGYFGAMTRVVGDRLERVAATSTPGAEDPGVRAAWSVPLDGESVHAKAIHDGAPVNIADALTEPGVSDRLRAVARGIGYRSLVAVPLLHHNEAIGTIAVTRREPGGFTDDEIALLKTFADQAVIAIEDARLLTELQTRTAELTRSVGQLTALGEVGQAVSSTLDLETVLTTIVTRAAQLAGTDGGAIYEYDEAAEEFRLRAEQGLEGVLVAARREVGIRRGEGAVGGLAVTRVPIQFADIAEAGAYEGRLRDMLLQAGVRSLLAVPVLREDRLVGGLVVNRKRPGTFAPEVVELLETFATQSALAIQNARLFREIEAKSRELEVASRHKSEFLANMSHELRTPLNAIIGYSELLEEEAGDLDGGRLVPDLQKIGTAAKHQLSLINDILDLSKIEAGRMELELTDFHLPTTLDHALTLVRERATRRGIKLQATMDPRLGAVRADERKIKQVVLNLLSNAIKFTPEGGQIEVSAAPRHGAVEVSVHDSGVGIAPEDQEAVFEEFRQVGTADKKVEGTGLGLALSRKFIELHGGRIWVESQVGHGSTFTFTLPVRREE